MDGSADAPKKPRRGLFKTMKSTAEAASKSAKANAQTSLVGVADAEQKAQEEAQRRRAAANEESKAVSALIAGGEATPNNEEEESSSDPGEDFLGITTARRPVVAAPAPTPVAVVAMELEGAVDVLGRAMEEERREAELARAAEAAKPDGLALLSAYGESSSSDDEAHGPTVLSAGGASPLLGGKRAALDPAIERELKKQKKGQFRDFDPAMMMDLSASDVFSKAWKINSGDMTEKQRQEALTHSVWDQSTKSMMHTQQASGVMKSKHQIGWLAADVFENEDELVERGQAARAHRKRAKQKYGW